MKKSPFILLILFSTALWAGNSIFSFEGYPVQFYGRDIYSMGMGGTGSSDIFRLNTGYANPALYNKTNRTLFGTGLAFGLTNYQSSYTEAGGVENKSSFIDDSLDFPYFSFSTPFKKHRFGFQFNSYASGYVKNKHLIDGSTSETHLADRYLYKADLIYSYRYKELSLGLSGNYYFGHDNRSFSMSSDEISIPTEEKITRRIHSPSMGFGVLQGFKKHSVGLNLNLPVNLSGESVFSSLHNEEIKEDYEYQLPMRLGFGYTALLSKEIKLSLDTDVEYYTESEDGQKNGMRVAAGLAYEPERKQKENWYMKFPVRAGFSYRQLPFESQNAESISETAFSLGFSLPLKGEVNKLDIALEYAKRGSLSKNELQDGSFMLMLGLTGIDIITKAPDRTAPREIPQAEDLNRW